jgi:hypothetical protein
MFEAEMARKCHRRKSGPALFFFGEQFWGRAARASLDSRESKGARYFWTLFVDSSSAKATRWTAQPGEPPVPSILFRENGQLKRNFNKA